MEEVVAVVEDKEVEVVEDVEEEEVEVVVGSVVVGAELELVVEVVDMEVTSAVVGSVEVVSVVDSDVVVGSVVVVVTGTEVATGSEWVVALLSRFMTFRRLANVSSSSCRASAAWMSVGKTPCWNLLDRACRASCMEFTLIPANTSWRDSRWTPVSSIAD